MEPIEYNQLFTHEDHHWWYRALRRQFRLELSRCGILGSSAERPAKPVCLDAGCGTGKTLSTFKDRFQGIGLDISRQALELTNLRGISSPSHAGPSALVQASVNSIPIRDSSLDLIICADVLYHNGVPDDVAALAEMGRCLNPGGLIVLNLPAFNWLYSEHDKAIHTARRYSRKEVEDKIRKAGLTPVRVRYWNWLLFPPLAIMRLTRKLIGSGRPRAGAEKQAGSPAPKSDLYQLPRFLNELMNLLLKMEITLAGLPVPAGLSIIAVARK